MWCLSICGFLFQRISLNAITKWTNKRVSMLLLSPIQKLFHVLFKTLNLVL